MLDNYEEKLSRRKKLCKISLIVELIVFLLVVGVHGAIEKRRMGTELKEHYMQVVDVDKSVSRKYDSQHKTRVYYNVKFAVMINGDKTWFNSNNSQLDYTTLNTGSKVKIYEYKGKYSTKLDDFTVKGPYKVILYTDILAVMISIWLYAMVWITESHHNDYKKFLDK